MSEFVKMRRSLLPPWIRWVSWAFLAFLVLVPALHVANLLGYQTPTLIFLGFQSTGSLTAPGSLLIQYGLFLLGVVGYGLLRGRDWGPAFAISVAWICVGLEALTFVSQLFQEWVYFPFTVLLLIPFALKLRSVEAEWLGARARDAA